VLTTHADLLRQEVNVKHVEVLSEPDRYVTKTLRLNTPDLGKRLKQRLPALQRTVAAGDYVIHPDGTLRAGDVVLHPGEYSYRMEVADQREAVAAEGNVVVLLDVARDDSLRMEGDARDLNRVIQDLRKRARLRYSDRIVVSISGSGLEPLLAAFGPWLMEQALAVGLTTTQLDDFYRCRLREAPLGLCARRDRTRAFRLARVDRRIQRNSSRVIARNLERDAVPRSVADSDGNGGPEDGGGRSPAMLSLAKR
jgi:hypothetical protein